MRYRTLGRTGIKVSVLGFGCMRLPTQGAPDRIDEVAATKLLHDAIDMGVNYVDTAWFYHAPKFGQAGQSEPFVGERFGRRMAQSGSAGNQAAAADHYHPGKHGSAFWRSSSNGSKRTISTSTSCTGLTEMRGTA